MGAYKSLFNSNIQVSLKTAAQVFSAYPASAGAFIRLNRAHKEAEKRRRQFATDGFEVPPVMIVSTTDECNLACAGCYACERGKSVNEGITDGRAVEILDEASALGVGVVLLAGGEPLLSQGWLDALALHPEMAGLVFSNGTLLDEKRCVWLQEHRHIIPVLSLEGGESATDARRGDGVFAKVTAAMALLRGAGVPFGVSVTATRENIDDVLTDGFTTEYIQKGCRLFVYVEYVPVAKGTDALTLTKADKVRLSSFAVDAERRHGAVFIAFPGDEAQYGGCLAAGRGFIHISTGGDVEPCPFAPFSDTNLKDKTLKEALQSKLLRVVRDNHDKLVEGEGGCALWHNREWLKELAGEN